MTAAPRRAGPVCPAVTGVGIRLPSPPSEREVSARSADGGRDATRFPLPQSAAPTAPSQRGPNSAALPRCWDVETPSPTGGSTYRPVGRGLCAPPPGTHFSAGHMGPALQNYSFASPKRSKAPPKGRFAVPAREQPPHRKKGILFRHSRGSIRNFAAR